MKRKDALTLISTYASQGEERLAMRIYVENRIGYEAFIKALEYGRKIKKKESK